ncbi:peptidoglycan bridge formation glycyltransferase FemA/FemB family protein [bacterium]|nr:peptidoglycan bridge formation glycyltransferase FemA/FemB family protein [bacterium]
MQIRQAQEQDSNHWDAYFNKHANGTFYHQWAWRSIVEKIHRHKPLYFIAEENGVMLGGLPLFHMKTFLGGSVLLSIPAAVVGGICFENSEVELLLIEKAISEARRLNVDYLVLRQIEPLHKKMVVDDRYANIIVPLTDMEEHFKKLNKDIRRRLKRCFKEDMEIEIFSKDIDTFYKLYSQGMKRFGTPVEGPRWIKSVFHAFPDNHFISNVKYKNKIIMTKMVRIYKDQIFPVISYGDPEYKNLYPQHLLTWKLMEKGYQDGQKFYNFGRCIKDSGVHKFKMGWNSSEETLYYHYYLHNQKAMPDHSHSSNTRQRYSKIWRYLPTPVTNIVGPMIRRCYL